MKNCFESTCSNPCHTLNGNLTFECGGCSDKIACHPGAHGYSKSSASTSTDDAAYGPLIPLCNPDGSLLPLLHRFCRRAAHRCNKVRSSLSWHMEHIQPADGVLTRAAILHRERPRVGAGYAHVLQEHAQLLMLGIVLSRPVHIYSEGGSDVFNHRGALLGPGAMLAARLYKPLESLKAGYANLAACRSARESMTTAAAMRALYQCRRVDGGQDDGDGRGTTRWFLTLEDGDAWSVINGLKQQWNRFTHLAKPNGRLKEYFPTGPIMFSSPSVIAMYISDFAKADATIDVKKRNHRASVAQLIDGSNDLAGPSCLLRSMISRAAESVLEALKSALQPMDGGNALLVGVHVRRGDHSMQSECPSCINSDDPDVVDKQERISTDRLNQQASCVNASLNAIELSTGTRTYAFVASDTVEGLRVLQGALGAHRVLFVPGSAVHSTRSEGRVKVAADFLGLAAADVHFGLGDSSFLGNAAAAGMGRVLRVGDRVASGNVCKPLTTRELEDLRRELAVEGGSMRAVHVEL